MIKEIIIDQPRSLMRGLGPLALGVALLSAVVWSVSAESGPVIVEKVGQPGWKLVDFKVFAAPVGTFESGFVEFGQTMQALLPPPNHEPCAELGIGPGTPHTGYKGELATGVANNEFADKTTFHVSEFSLPSGIWAVWMVVPGAKSPEGSSPDFNLGPIIPNAVFPIAVEGATFRNGEPFNSGLAAFSVPPLTDQLSCPFDVDGYSHFPLFFADAKEFGPADLDPAGQYEYRVQMRDQTGSGWNISVQFRVTPK